MIAEALEWLTTPCPRWARRNGYLGESIAIRHRARRCAAHWSEHQANTRAAILRAAASLIHHDHVLVLGAGACLDVPLADLASRFAKVTLIDAVRSRGLKLPGNARYLTRDIHGVMEALSAGRDDRGAPLANLDRADLTVSVNLLSQLPRLPIRAMRRQGLIAEAECETAAHQIMDEHVRDMTAREGARLIIADARHRLMDNVGNLLRERDIADAVGLTNPLESWVWPVAPPGERGDGLVEESTVGVWHL